MAYTVAEVFEQVRRIYQDCPDDSTLLKMMNDEHFDICRYVKLYPDTTVNVSLTAGTREYALSASVLHIWNAAYFTSATAYTPLRQTSRDRLDNDNMTWLQQSNGVPYLYYESGGYVGFYPTPNTTTSAGYPIVTLYCQSITTFSATSDSLPSQINNADPWIYGLARRFAAQSRVEDVPRLDALSRQSRADLAAYIASRTPRRLPSVRFSIPTIKC